MAKIQSNHRHHRVDTLWDADADKYRVFCRKIHVTKATQFIGLVQLVIMGIFSIALLFFATKNLNGNFNENELLGSMGRRYITSFFTAMVLQLALVLMMLQGVRTERRSLLLPFIIFASFAVFLAFVQASSDFVAAAQEQPGAATGTQLFCHIIGMCMHLWCVGVVWRCYCYLGDKKVAEQIGQQLQVTSLAFAYDYSQPPPYADTVVEKHPLTIA
ncbi:unnamed protein product [Auanema sp. JU1783]|nr:unnamed protein product [Auanema sp. JU1783]